MYTGSICVCGVTDEGQALRWAHEAQPPAPALPPGAMYCHEGNPPSFTLTCVQVEPEGQREAS